VSSNVERKIVLVTRRTRLEELVVRHHSLAQAKFYIEHLGADFADYQREHETYEAARHLTLEALVAYGRYQAIDRAFLPNFLFGAQDIVVTLGQDGLVANSFKYLDGHPVIGLNPEPARFDGVLLPFAPRDLAAVLRDVVAERRPSKIVSMAEAKLTDGQTLRAVNDFFIGPRTHTSARYEIALGNRHEIQSSSGVIVSTGFGSTAWFRSVVTGSLGIAAALSGRRAPAAGYKSQPWDSDQLQFAVREPFPSKTTQASLVYGQITGNTPLRLRSLMAENGVIFSDGMEADHLAFTTGMEATIGLSRRQGRLVM
jgi:NAD kinase